MSDFLNKLGGELHALAGWEAVAVVLALAYLVLAMRRSLWCWPAAFVSTLIYTLLFWKVALLMESALNIYYMGMAVFGFWQWRFGGKQGTELQVQAWSRASHLKLIAATGIASLACGSLMANYTHADFAYLDAATTCFAVVTTYLVAIKVLENWLYWIVIDAVSIYLYMEKGLLLTSLLFVVYIVLAVFGYLNWRREFERRVPEPANAVA